MYQCQEEYWRNWIIYYRSPPRQIVLFQIDEVNITNALNTAEHLGEPESTAQSSDEEPMEVGLVPSQGTYCRRRNPIAGPQTSPTSSRAGSQISGSVYIPNTYQRRRIADYHRLKDALKTFVCVPIYSTCETLRWLQDPYLCYFDKTDLEYRRAVNGLQRETQFLNFFEIAEWIGDPACDPLWLSRSSDHYLGRRESKDLLERLLLHQCHGYHDDMVYMLRVFYDILERNLPKMNTIFISGQPNSGKTFFVNCVSAYYLNIGVVTNFVRGNNFPLNDCVARRILIWNEPSCMPSAWEDVKLLTGGDPCPVSVKYQGHSVILKTPLIVTSNNDSFFPRTEAYTSRIYSRVWQPAYFLKDVKQQLSPWAYYDIIMQYVLE